MTLSLTNFLDVYQGFGLIYVKVSELITEYGPRTEGSLPALRRCAKIPRGSLKVVSEMNVNMEYIAPSPAP